MSDKLENSKMHDSISDITETLQRIGSMIEDADFSNPEITRLFFKTQNGLNQSIMSLLEVLKKGFDSVDKFFKETPLASAKVLNERWSKLDADVKANTSAIKKIQVIINDINK